MTIMEMLGQSGVLTLLGMGVVFGFLVIMIIVISQVGKIINASGVTQDAGAAPGAGSVPLASTGNNAAITAAISAAVNEYRKSN